MLGVCAFLLTGPARAEVDNTIYAALLHKYVQDGAVSYQGFKNDEQMLDQYLDVLAGVDAPALTRDERFAFYVNAYNAWTIKLILSRYPNVQSIKDLGGFLQSPWSKPIARIDGAVLSLDNIEHDILRPQFKDPRVHFAVNCASKGCPPLLGEPYTGVQLNSQLDGVARAFINDPERNRLDGQVLYVSQIFKWFAADFDNDIIAFFKRFAAEPLKTALERRASDIKITYLEYDWSLNRP
jgi:hypothetical protein